MNEKETFESLLKTLIDPGLTIFDAGGLASDSLETHFLEFHRFRFEKIVALARSRAKETFPQIIFDYIDLDQVNAFACVDVSGKGYVGVTAEAIIGIYDLFYRMLSHPEILLHIGNPASEIIHPHHSQGPFRTYAERLSERTPTFTTLHGVRPRDPIRAAYAESLGLIAIDFLMHHEVGHILLGHCQYPEVIGTRLLILESASSGRSPGVPVRLIDQAIEFHADAYAFAQVSRNHVLQVHPSRIQTRASQEKRANLLEPPNVVLSPFEAVLSDCLLAYNLFCWMMGLDLDLETLLADDHPPAFLRFFTCTAFPDIVSPPPESLGIDIHHSFKVAFTAATYRASVAHLILNGDIEASEADTLAKESTSHALIEHAKLVNDQFKTIASDLNRLSHLRSLSTVRLLT